MVHKNLIASAVVALIVVSMGFYFTQNENGGASRFAKNTATQKTPATTDDAMLRDSDADDLPDWEERLRGSDPFVADTDKDGTTDGAEVLAGRDPIKKGPNDIVPVLAGPNFATSSSDLYGIKKEFFAKYLATASREVRETTFRDLVKGFNPEKFTPTNELLDLNVSSDTSDEALRVYGNDFGLIIKKYTAKPLRTEEEILKEGLATKSDASLKDLQLLIIAYRNFSRDLKALPVPIPLAEEHLKIVNGYDGMSRGLLGMLRLFSNPVDGAAGYQTYTRMRLEMVLGYSGVVAYLSKRQIVFSQSEPGYPLYGHMGTTKK